MKSLDEELFIREENGIKTIILDLPREKIRKKIFSKVPVEKRDELFFGEAELYLDINEIYRVEIYQDMVIELMNGPRRNSYIGIEAIGNEEKPEWIFFDHEDSNEIPRVSLRKNEKLIIGKYIHEIGDEKIPIMYFAHFNKYGYLKKIDVMQVPITYGMNVSFKSLVFVSDEKGRISVIRNKNDPYMFLIRRKNGRKEEKILI
ncbi:MAG: hypothetical protein J7K83_00405 [Candidatus Aenigmarchaeota archaeon]|nr:hypothetical protein [Candidatus Aenigmarchaeota archaeon]